MVSDFWRLQKKCICTKDTTIILCLHCLLQMKAIYAHLQPIPTLDMGLGNWRAWEISRRQTFNLTEIPKHSPANRIRYLVISAWNIMDRTCIFLLMPVLPVYPEYKSYIRDNQAVINLPTYLKYPIQVHS